MRPILDDEKAIEKGFDPVEDEALDITRKTRAALAKAPSPKTVWNKFGNFVNKYNWKKTPYFAPIASGYNINGFDMIIVTHLHSDHYGGVERLQEIYGPNIPVAMSNKNIYYKINTIEELEKRGMIP